MEFFKQLLDIIAQAIEVLAPFKDGILYCVFWMLINRILNQRIFTKTAHFKQRPVWFWWWGRKLIPAYPFIAALGIGRWLQHGPTVFGSTMYFMVCGGMSVSVYEMAKQAAKKRGFDIDAMPGED